MRFPGKPCIPWALVVAASCVKHDMTGRGSSPSLILQLLHLWPQVFEGEHNLASNSTLSINVMVCTG